MKKPSHALLPQSVLEILADLKREGFRYGICGGWPRNMIWGLPALDIDIFVEGDIREFAKRRGFQSCYFNKIFKDSQSGAQLVPVRSILENMDSFDFTINCSALLDTGEFIAFPHALEDIERRILRKHSGQCDYRVIIRGCRFAASYGLTMEESCRKEFKSLYRFHGCGRFMLEAVSIFSLKHELVKCMGKDAKAFFAIFSQCGMFRPVFPELAELYRTKPELAERIIEDSVLMNDKEKQLEYIISQSFACRGNRNGSDLKSRLEDFGF